MGLQEQMGLKSRWEQMGLKSRAEQMGLRADGA